MQNQRMSGHLISQSLVSFGNRKIKTQNSCVSAPLIGNPRSEERRNNFFSRRHCTKLNEVYCNEMIEYPRKIQNCTSE